VLLMCRHGDVYSSGTGVYETQTSGRESDTAGSHDLKRPGVSPLPAKHGPHVGDILVVACVAAARAYAPDAGPWTSLSLWQRVVRRAAWHAHPHAATSTDALLPSHPR
jgi:hypothetical protein